MMQYCPVVDFWLFVTNLTCWHFVKWTKTCSFGSVLAFYSIGAVTLYHWLTLAHRVTMAAHNQKWFMRTKISGIADDS